MLMTGVDSDDPVISKTDLKVISASARANMRRVGIEVVG